MLGSCSQGRGGIIEGWEETAIKILGGWAV